MQKVQSICTMREIVLGLHKLEDQLIQQLGIDLREATLICCLADQSLSASEIASRLELKMPHTSKILSSLEKKELLSRTIGKEDKRKMFFALNKMGLSIYEAIKDFSFDVPPPLDKLF